MVVSGAATGGGGETISGFIIEKRDGANIVAITAYRYKPVFDDTEIERFLALMVTAFNKAGAVR